MKVLLINGSPHREGCTYTALCEVSRALNDNGVDTDIFWIGNKALSGCIACKNVRAQGNVCSRIRLMNSWRLPEIMTDSYSELPFTGRVPQEP